MIKKILSRIFFGSQVKEKNGTIDFWGSFKKYSLSRLKFILIIIGIPVLLRIPFYYASVKSAQSFETIYDKKDLFERRNYLLDRILDPQFSIKDMPFFIDAVYQGEWAYGTLSMTAIGLYNLSQLFPESKTESAKALDQLISIALKKDFRKFETKLWKEDALETVSNSNGHLGILGHLNLMLALFSQISEDSKYEILHHKINQGLKTKLSQKCPIAETYPNHIFVPDNLAALASLTLSKDTSAKEFAKVWFKKNRTLMVDKSENYLFMLYADCTERIEARGIGAGWNVLFLPLIDTLQFKKDYQTLKTNFVRKTPLGYWAVRDHTDGNERTFGDIDSGPLFFGFSAPATAFALAGALKMKDTEFIQDIFSQIEILGWTVSWNEKRFYFNSPLVGDAILFAAMTMPPLK